MTRLQILTCVLFVSALVRCEESETGNKEDWKPVTPKDTPALQGINIEQLVKAYNEKFNHQPPVVNSYAPQQTNIPQMDQYTPIKSYLEQQNYLISGSSPRYLSAPTVGQYYQPPAYPAYQFTIPEDVSHRIPKASSILSLPYNLGMTGIGAMTNAITGLYDKIGTIAGLHQEGGYQNGGFASPYIIPKVGGYYVNPLVGYQTPKRFYSHELSAGYSAQSGAENYYAYYPVKQNAPVYASVPYQGGYVPENNQFGLYTGAPVNYKQ